MIDLYLWRLSVGPLARFGICVALPALPALLGLALLAYGAWRERGAE